MPAADFVTVDVFTTERFTGNPLAVIPDARGLSDDQMQKIATEFGYSESTFVLPPENPENSARVRIFTPTMEVPFAGHPNVGTAYVLGQLPDLFGAPVGDKLRFEEKAGIVEVDVRRENGRVTSTAIRAPKTLEIGDTVATDLVAECLSLPVAAIRTDRHAPLFASVGLAFVMVEIQSIDALSKARPDLAAITRAASLHPGDGLGFSLFLYVADADRPRHLRTRMFAPLDDVPEDPATGSASAALAAYLVTTDGSLAADGVTTIAFEQGVEMGRRSSIGVDVEKRGGHVLSVLISGQCAPVMRGSIEY